MVGMGGAISELVVLGSIGSGMSKPWDASQ